MSKKKAVTYDGFSDKWIRETKNPKLLMNWWNNDSIKWLSDNIFEARLIPLNKVWPKIPTVE